jgi:uncharacterized membrane protein (DUF485 family)
LGGGHRPEETGVHKSVQEMLDSAEFHALVRKKWTISIALTSALFVTYYGYILLVALNKPLLATKVGVNTTLGIPVGVAVILGAWVLTAIYIVWANKKHDAEVASLRDRLSPSVTATSTAEVRRPLH